VHVTKNASVEDQWAARFADLLGVGDLRVNPDYPGAVSRIADALEVLTPAEMGKADALTIAGGTTGLALMEKAGLAVAEAVRRHVPVGARIAVMTGPGNNGGDGFVAARLLAEASYVVRVGTLSPRESLKGDASLAAASWTGTTEDLSPGIVREADLIIDALFGAGLDRPVTGVVAHAIDAVNRADLPVIAVDLPSGVNGLTGAVMGIAVEADESVTFFRLKPGHMLLPGRSHVGRLTVADIGIASDVLKTIRPNTWRNMPGFWTLPPFAVEAHKYSRGHTVVVSGIATRTGAARLAARAALRVGSGLVTVASPPEALAVNAAHLTAIMLLPMEGARGLASILADERRNAVVLGPALGVAESTVHLVEAALASQATVVLDADGLTSFAGDTDRLFAIIKARGAGVVLTPHEGEFARLFPNLAATDSKLERARLAAEQSGAVVILKGPDTVVAAPDGHATIADNAPPQLGTAGSGDVLAGMVGGLLAQGMTAFAAASAAVWLHGEAGLSKGRGLIAEDLPEVLPGVFAELTNRSH
jgi:ADP-dependent NAD(P)H-hydrate dehydratase / NAD(P)H-hydrate epimerase